MGGAEEKDPLTMSLLNTKEPWSQTDDQGEAF